MSIKLAAEGGARRIGAAAMPESALDAQIGKHPFAPKLTEEQKHQVCQWYAQFVPQVEILRRVKEEWGIDWRADSVSTMVRSSKWMPLIDRLRQEWAAGVMDLPLAHKRGRMQRLALILEKSQDDPKLASYTRYMVQLKALGQMREEMDEKTTTTFNTLFLTNITNYSDEELLRRRDEVYAKLEQLRAVGKGPGVTQEVVDVHATEA